MTLRTKTALNSAAGCLTCKRGGRHGRLDLPRARVARPGGESSTSALPSDWQDDALRRLTLVAGSSAALAAANASRERSQLMSASTLNLLAELSGAAAGECWLMCESTEVHSWLAPRPMMPEPTYTCVALSAKPRMRQPKAQQPAVAQMMG